MTLVPSVCSCLFMSMWPFVLREVLCKMLFHFLRRPSLPYHLNTQCHLNTSRNLILVKLKRELHVHPRSDYAVL